MLARRGLAWCDAVLAGIGWLWGGRSGRLVLFVCQGLARGELVFLEPRHYLICFSSVVGGDDVRDVAALNLRQVLHVDAGVLRYRSETNPEYRAVDTLINGDFVGVGRPHVILLLGVAPTQVTHTGHDDHDDSEDHREP